MNQGAEERMDFGTTIIALTVGLFLAGLVIVALRDLAAKRSPWPSIVVYALAIWPMVVNINTPRYITYDQYTGLASMDLPEWPESLSRLAWVLTAVLSLYVLTRLLSRGWRLVPAYGLRILGAYLLCVSAAVMSALAGTPGGGFSHSLFRPHVMISAVVLADAQRRGEVLAGAKWASLAWTTGSIIAAGVAPEWALFESGRFVDGPLPFPRLYGLCANPNGLAPIALLYLYLEYFIPSRRVVRVAGSALAVTVIVLSQSKTSWGVAIISAYVLYLYRKGASAPAPVWSRMGSAVFVTAIALVAVWSSGGLFTGDPELRTLTGRTELWSVTMSAWRSSPIFGYGPTLWNEAFRAQFLRSEASYAGHAHNVYVQQLAESGVIGLVALLVFLGALAKTAWSARHSSRGLSLALLLNLVIAGVTESTLIPRSMDQAGFGMGALLALAIACSSPRPWHDSRPAKGAIGSQKFRLVAPARTT